MFKSAINVAYLKDANRISCLLLIWLNRQSTNVYIYI